MAGKPEPRYDIIFIAGAPGAGKSSVTQALAKELGSPFFEFGWIPEFRTKGGKIISYVEEEGLAFENLTLVVKNYVKHAFKNILVADLEDKRITELHRVFRKQKYALFTLTVADDTILRSRVRDVSRSSKYRNTRAAVQINNTILARPLLPREVRIDTTSKPVQKVVREICNHL